MKKTLFVLCLFFTPAAFAQGYLGSVSSQPIVYQSPSHPAQATYAPMAQSHSILSSASYSSAQEIDRRPIFPR